MSKYAPSALLWRIFVAGFCCNMLAVQAYGLEESIQAGGSNAAAVHQLGETGEGVNIGLIMARNVRDTHEAFKDGYGVSHAFNYDFSGSGILIDWHDTRLAGIISSRGGAAFPNDIGVAPGADIYCARIVDDACSIDWYELSNALAELTTTHNCKVIVTGFQLEGIPYDGNSYWTLLYDYYAYQNGVVFANAAGNNNTDVTIFGDAYNGITTGGLRLNDVNNQFDYRRVGSISGSGPTDDGRRKPDITAPSQSQTVPTSSSDTAWTTTGTTLGETSWSVPHTAGAAALLLGLADNTSEPNDNRSEVIKAVLVNSVMPNINDKAGNFTNPADSNNAWQNQRGYGRLDALRAYQTLNTNEVEPDVNITQNKGWAFGQLTQGATNTYTISIAMPCRLIATLTWQRKIEWVDKWPRNQILEPDELHTYLADLDMIVYSPYEPNAIFSQTLFNLDPNDNLEKCDLLVTEPGDYTIVIDNDSTNGETADYGLAFELHPIMTGDLPQVDYIVDYNDLSTLAEQWLLEGVEIDWLLSPNGIIDFADLAKLADHWLQTDPMYYPAQ
ncbi:MAG: S8 family serine peptidase [Planctomycetota bacterium]